MTSQYFDDFPVCEPSFCGQSGRTALRDVAASLGLPFSDDLEKSLALAPRRVFLGVETDFTAFRETRVTVTRLTQERADGLREAVGSVLQDDAYDAAGGAGHLVGRLGFGLTWACNRYGRAALQPLHLAAAADSGDGASLGAAARAALRFFWELLALGLPGRRFTSRRGDRRRPILIWSDAMWEETSQSPAGIGFVVFIPADGSAEGSREGKWYYSYARVGSVFMERFVARRQYIGQLELLGAVAVYYSLMRDSRTRHALPGRDVIHYVDNSGAAAALCKGYGRAVDSARIVHAMWAAACAIGCSPWFLYIRTKGNIADVPSRFYQARDRGEEAEFAAEMAYITADLGAEWIDMVVPAVLDWPAASGALAAVASGLAVDEGASAAGSGNAAGKRVRDRGGKRARASV